MLAQETKRILIVEDEVIIVEDLESRLKGFGYAVCGEASSGEAALDLVELLQPDLVMMDIVLEGDMDGIDAAAVIKDKWGIPVVFLTSYHDSKRLERAKLTYPFGYLLKPFQERDLKVTLEMALYVSNVEAERKEAEILLKESERKYRLLAQNIRDVVWLLDMNLNLTYVSPSVEWVIRFTPEELMAQRVDQIFTPDSGKIVIQELTKVLRNAKHGEGIPDNHLIEAEHLTKDGGKIWASCKFALIEDENKKPLGLLGVSRDITTLKLTMEELQSAHDELELRVKERTQELESTQKRLEEVNSALNVMLKKLHEDRKLLEQNILFNVNELIDPIIRSLKNSGLNKNQNAYVNTLETFLGDITSPFSHRLSATYADLTLSEIKVANLIKEGKTTKEIAVFLNLTQRAVEFHRQNIRRKLGLRNRKVSLGSHLLSAIR